MRALFALLLVLLVSPPAKAEDWSDPDLGGHIAEGVATHQFIWLRGSNGALVRFDRTSGERTVLATDAIDILADGERLWVLSGIPGQQPFTIRDIRAPDAPARVFQPHAAPIALVAGKDGRPGELMADGYLQWDGDHARRTNLPATLARFPLAATDASGVVYAGYNLGEWGGGLRRIDPETGTISFVSGPAAPLCGGRLNPACEPVVGLFRDHQRPACMIVGTGLAHLSMSFGRVYQVCGTEIRETWTTPGRGAGDPLSRLPSHWVLDDLVETSDGWIGLSTDRYFLNRNGEVTERPMPAFQEWSGLRIAEADGAVFIVAACCWGSQRMELYRTLALPISD